MEPIELSEELKTFATITRHVALVRKNLQGISQELDRRGLIHDLSKVQLDELGGFINFNRAAREHPYGSEEYKRSMVEHGGVIDLHFSRNSHHPEHHPNGVADMGLFDIIEMVCDWKAASETYGQTSFEEALAIQVDRFGLTSEQVYVINLIAQALA